VAAWEAVAQLGCPGWLKERGKGEQGALPPSPWPLTLALRLPEPNTPLLKQLLAE